MISVAMATFQGERYLEAQLDSILPQLGDEDELLISDDGSTDGTKEILSAYAAKDARIRLLTGPRAGIISNFEFVIRECRGDVIFLSDQDDVWAENKVRRVMEVFARTGAALVMHDAVVKNEDLSETIYPSFFAYRGCRTGYLANIIKNRYIGCCMAFQSRLRDVFLPIPKTIQMHDQWIGLAADRIRGGSALLREPLLSYRRHEGTGSDFSHNSVPVMIRNRLVLLRELKKASRKKCYENVTTPLTLRML